MAQSDGQGNANVVREHPEDKKARIRGQQYGRRHAPAFTKERGAEMIGLISTYADDEARRAFEHLREAFWARLWKPKTKGTRPQGG